MLGCLWSGVQEAGPGPLSGEHGDSYSPLMWPGCLLVLILLLPLTSLLSIWYVFFFQTFIVVKYILHKIYNRNRF